MKSLLKPLCISFILLSCNAKDESIEDKMYACVHQHYKEYGIELNAALDSLENYFISKNILSSSDGAGKIQFFQDVIRTGQFPDIERIQLMDELTNHFYGDDYLRNCLFAKKDLDSSAYLESKYFKNAQAISNEVLKQGYLSPVSVSKAILTHLTQEDFEKPMYRAHALLFMAITSERNEGMIQQVPSRINEPSVGEGKGFTIELATQNELFLNGKKNSVENVRSELLQYFESCTDPRRVQFIVQGSSNYGLFAKIAAQIESACLSFWNAQALKDYTIELSKLSASDQDEIKNRYPIQIDEIVRK